MNRPIFSSIKKLRTRVMMKTKNRNIMMKIRVINYRRMWYFTTLNGFPTFKTVEDNICIYNDQYKV